MSSSDPGSGTSQPDGPPAAAQALDPTSLYPTAAAAGPWRLPGDRYRVVEEIGRGGMGVVLRVHDTSFDRSLAVKVMLPAAVSYDQERRFLEEAGITGRLQHPGIPPVHDVGRLSDGRPFFSMKLIEGCTLAELLRRRPGGQGDLPDFLKIFEQVAQTLAYAHSQGIIHRDLKPLNIMVGAFGEVQVMDWGLAKRLPRGGMTTPVCRLSKTAPPPGDKVPVDGDKGDDSHTQAGQVLGTFAYMAPEQARGEVAALDERCDVFGLGAILCMILTGRPPYDGRHRATLQQAQRADLAEARARLDACGTDAELIQLTKACLAPDKYERLPNAGEVARALGRYFASVQKRLEQAHVARAQAEVKAQVERQHRRLAVSLAVAVVLIVVGASGAGLWYARDQAQRQAQTAARRAYLEAEVGGAVREAQALRQQLHEGLQDDFRAAQLLSDPEQWQGLLQSARAAWKRADRLAGDERDLLSEPLHTELDRLGELLQTDEQDRQFAAALDRVRQETANYVEGQIKLRPAAPKLARIFTKAGYEVEQSSPARVAGRIRQSVIRLALVAGLDFWALASDDDRLRTHLLEAARRADPEPWRDLCRQPDAWRSGARLAALAAEVDCSRQTPHLLAALAQLLSDHGGDAGGLLRRAIVFHPRDFWLHFQLGLASGNREEQAGAFRAALAVRPSAAVAHYNLGVLEQAAGHLHHALACYQRAIECDPRNAGVYNNLGLVLDKLSRPDEAIARLRTATLLEPGNGVAHLNLGGVLHRRGRLDEAILCYRKAIALIPGSAAAYNNLGGALRDRKELDEAVSCLHKAIELDIDHALAWCNLAQVLRQQGKFGAAVLALRQGHQLGSTAAGWSYPSGQWLRQAEQGLALARALPGIVGRRAADGQEQRRLAELCVSGRHYAAAVRFYRESFGTEPKLAEDPVGTRYHAGCIAALAAAGQGQPTGKPLPDAERADCRRQALAWLRAELAGQAKALGQPRNAAPLAQTLEQWQKEPRLASLRERSALARLPSEDRRAWQELWADVADLRARAVKQARQALREGTRPGGRHSSSPN